MAFLHSAAARQALTQKPKPRVSVVYSREEFAEIPLPDRVAAYPELRYMGSKNRLLPWIHGVLRPLPFETAADPFVGSGWQTSGSSKWSTGCNPRSS